MRRTLTLGAALVLVFALGLGAAPHIPSKAFAAAKQTGGTTDAGPPRAKAKPMLRTKPVPPARGKKAMKAQSGSPKTHTLPGGIICTETGTKDGVQGTLDCRPAPRKK